MTVRYYDHVEKRDFIGKVIIAADVYQWGFFFCEIYCCERKIHKDVDYDDILDCYWSTPLEKALYS